MDGEQAKKPESIKWYYQPVVVVVLLLPVLLGPLALPLLWKSPKFNRAARIILTILVGVLTIYVCYLGWPIVKQAIQRLSEYPELQ